MTDIAWKLKPPPPPDLCRRLAEEVPVHPLVAAVLARRGVTDPEAARAFLQPSLEHLHDPFLLKGMDAAVRRIGEALKHGQRIVVSGDYDVDGVTSTALLSQFLKDVGAEQVDYFIPNRFEHGYGLTPRSVDALLAMEPQLIVTVDNGITARAEVARLNAAGIDTVITDHHLPPQTGIPDGIVVNPLQAGCAYPFKRISGVGLAFKLMMALRKHLREAGWFGAAVPEPNLLTSLDLVAVGTVADVVSLTGENRVLVHHGLKVLNRSERRLGLATLLGFTRLERVTAEGIAFQIAPRLNAAGRMADGSLGVRLLLSEDPEEALALAQQLEEENQNRRSRSDAMFRSAVLAIESEGRQEDAGILVASPEFHEGIIGIVAAKLAERYHRPVLVLAENGTAFKGSARSVEGVNVTEAIATGADLLEQFGGHAAAAGCTLPKANLEAFRARFVASCGVQLAQAEPPALLLEGRLDLGTLDDALVEQLLHLEPFGQENESPAFLLPREDVPEAPEILKERHFKWRLGRGVEMVGWSLAERVDPEAVAGYSVRLGFNEWRGTRRIQLTVQDVQDGRGRSMPDA